ncbi:HAD-IA family hydrolase [Brevibacillus thermoruber]|uniref:HAD-IA family hydrolase n=1 Tax=Brevibacillus thermoruber TaxID=33942 RepID=UPI00048ABF79|nr:HAD-IA family hydrolase [Brevibacillus thermoruber]
MSSKVLFWDFDGTLGHRRGGKWSSALLEALHEIEPDCDVTLDDLKPLVSSGFPWHHPDVAHTHLHTPELWWSSLRKQVIEKAYRSLGYHEHAAQRLALIAQETYIDVKKWALYEDALPVLERLKEQGWIHAVISNHVPELQDILNYLGLTDFISVIINFSLEGYEKPHPQLYQIALQKVGNPRTVWMIGDNLHADVLGAENVGIKGILVRTEEKRAAFQAKDLYEIPNILARVEQQEP